MKHLILSFAVWMAAVTPALAANGIREEPVRFKAGTEGTTVKGRLKGWEGVDYLVGARAGQRMTVTLHTDNPQNHFNVLPPGNKDESIFNGSADGNRFEGSLTGSGDYRIRVSLMRAAARRDEKANYRLDIRIAGGKHASSAAPAGDFADGLSGGPDFWEVKGVPRGGTLNLRAAPSVHERVVDEIGNGTVMRNLGCRMIGGQRWCQIARPENARARGWVAGRYLREASDQP